MRPPPKPASGGGATQLASRPTSNRPGGGVLRLRLRLLQAPAVVALAAALAVSSAATPPPAPAPAPLCNLPPTLSGSDGGGRQGEANRIRHPKSERAARCTSKCVSTCVLGGYGAPGVAGPFNIRRYVRARSYGCGALSLSLVVRFAAPLPLASTHLVIHGWMDACRPLVVFKDTFRSRQYW